jgi:succinyl-diaminopimelate desuccinylase
MMTTTTTPMTIEPIDPVALTAALVQRASVTPADEGALDVVAAALAPFGFKATRVDRGGIANLYLRRGEGGPVLGFNGHTDVVPGGDASRWTHAPFSGAVADGWLWGRGALDMKSGVAAFAAAASRWALRGGGGSVALLITGDEEADATDGTVALLDWMEATGERLDHCIVGEPTSAARVGDTIKIGRRGSLSARVIAEGVPGHVAYPARVRNPLHALARFLDEIASTPLDDGTEHFEPSSLQVTSVDVGNPADNVVPGRAEARFNIRFNDRHDSASLSAALRERAVAISASTGVALEMTFSCSGESFVTAPGPFLDRVLAAVRAHTGETPTLSTGGGTSDARFIRRHCPVLEIGLLGERAHGIDERVRVADIEALAALYEDVIEACLHVEPA